MTPALVDQKQRDSICSDLDYNIVVEAAAGTGKTYSLVQRLMTMLRTGRLTGGQHFAAVTFTRKAAAELRQRLVRELDKRLAALESSQDAGEELTNLRQAKKKLPGCYIGTIHSFCARLLRERPVEAGVNADFREIEEDEDNQLRREAWRLCEADIAKDTEMMHLFAQYDIDMRQLADGFVGYCEYPDVEDWVGREGVLSDADLRGFLAATDEYARRYDQFAAALETADAGTDAIIPFVRRLRSRLQRAGGVGFSVSINNAYILAQTVPDTKKLITQKQWKPILADSDVTVDDIVKQWHLPYLQDHVRPFLAKCRTAPYGTVLRAYENAKHEYDRIREERGLVNFADLLSCATRLVRDNPDVCAELAERYHRLLIDEVQDTDPIQAELVFRLAAQTPAPDWQNAPLRPGALFIVGDPKQSIYRFRRADITVYNLMKDKIVANTPDGKGMVLELSTNFRSRPEILDWVNSTWTPDPGSSGHPDTGRFCSATSEYSEYGPVYIPLAAPPAVPTPTGAELCGVHALSVTEKTQYEKVAECIQRALAAGVLIPDPDQKGAGPMQSRPVRPSDFLIITKATGELSRFALELRARGLRCLVSGGKQLQNSETLQVLSAYLDALADPDNPVRTVGALRGGLCGIADSELYAFHRAGGTFELLRNQPVDDSVARMLARMRQHRALFGAAAPLHALGALMEETGLWLYAASSLDPDNEAGAVSTALECLACEDIHTLEDLAEQLRNLREQSKADITPARVPDGSSVRIMNAHKTKGLEAPVVFLAHQFRPRTYPPTFAIDRSDSAHVRGGLAASASYGEHSTRVLAQPVGWQAMAEKEQVFLTAEKIRLNYVAATRAQCVLIVCRNDKGANTFLPPDVGAHCPELDLPSADLPPRPQPQYLPHADVFAAADAARAEAVAKTARQTYRVIRAKNDAHWASASPNGMLSHAAGSNRTPEQSAALGEVVHTVLQTVDLTAETALTDAIQRLAVALLDEHGLDRGLLEEVTAMAEGVLGSALGARVRAALAAGRQVCREAPYTRVIAGPDDNAAGIPHIERGVIDLAFEEDDGWVLVDYKSDTTADPGADARRHAAQLAAYRDAWAALTGSRVTETGIFFLRPKEYVQVS